LPSFSFGLRQNWYIARGPSQVGEEPVKSVDL
jgi:hypothetical protein